MSTPAPIKAEESGPDTGKTPEIQRAELASRLVDVLSLPTGQMNDNERAFTADILNQLFDHIPQTVKVEVSERLSQSMSAPALLLRRMLLEPIEVAGPLLKRLKDIPDGMLADAAGIGVLHREAIARRRNLSGFVVDAIFEHPDVTVIQQLLRRPEIEISEKRLDELVVMTEANVVMREPLLNRKELTPRHGFTMFWWLDTNGRRKVLSRFAMDRTVLQDALKSLYSEVFPEPNPDPITKAILKLCDRRHRARGPSGETVSIEVVQKTMTNAIANPSSDLCMAAGYMAGVSSKTAKRILLDPGGEPFAIMCKSVGISRSDFSDILIRSRLLREADSHGPEITETLAEYLIGIFDMIARDYSRTALRYWDWRRGMQFDPVMD